MDRSEFAAGIARAGVRLAVVLLAPLAVGILRLFAPLELTATGAAAWLPVGAATLAAASLGLATTILVVRGLRAGDAVRLAAAAGVGALAVGLAVTGLRALGALAAFPDSGLAIAGLVGAAFLLGASLLPDAPLRVRGARVAGAVVVFAAIEAALAGSIFLALPTSVVPWLHGGAAALATAAALSARSTGLGLVAGGLAAMAISRPGALDAVAPLAAFIASGLAMAWTAAAERIATRPARTAAGEDDEDDEDDAESSPPLLAWRLPSRAASAATPDDEANRLARELRGAIEELLETRRTIELQRAEIARAANIDPLTGVATRRAILERLRVEAAEARRYTHPLAVLLLDIDGFAAINHDNGLEVGDAVLRELALRLRLRMRAADALGRAGGDSFLAILPHTDERGATVFAEALMRRLSTRPVSSAAGEITVRVSIGVAFVRPGMTMSDEALLVAVDEALASAKAAGGNRIAFDRLHGLARLDERRDDVSEADPGADAG